LKLSAHFLAHGRYWKSGEEVPDELVPPDLAAVYGAPETVAESGLVTDESTTPTPGTHELSGTPAVPSGNRRATTLPATPGTHVKRGSSFKRISDPDVTTEPGEPTYRREGKAFIPA
jgi:hypothetical protein